MQGFKKDGTAPWYPWYLGRFNNCRKMMKIYQLRHKYNAKSLFVLFELEY